MSILMCKWAEPEPEEDDNESKKKVEVSKSVTTRSRKQSAEEKVAESEEPQQKQDSRTGKKSPSPAKLEKSGLFVNVKWAVDPASDTSCEQEEEEQEEEEEETNTTEDEQDKDPGLELEKNIKSEPISDAQEDEKKSGLVFSIKWAEQEDESSGSAEEEEDQKPLFINTIPAEAMGGKPVKESDGCDKDIVVKQEVDDDYEKSPKEKAEENKQGTILSIRWADAPGNEVESEPEPPSPSPSPPPPSVESTSKCDSDGNSSSVSTKEKKKKIPKCGPKSVMKKYRRGSNDSDTATDKVETRKRRSSECGNDKAKDAVVAKRTRPLVGPKSITKMVKKELDTVASTDSKSKRARCPSQKLIEWTKVNQKTKSVKKPKDTKASSTTEKRTFTPPPVQIKQEPVEIMEGREEKNESPVRKPRKARPSTFNQKFNTDPNSPYLYTTGQKGPMVRLECDLDEDNDTDFVPDFNDANDDDDDYYADDRQPEVGKKRGKSTPKIETTKPKLRKVKVEPEPVNDNGLSGLSLGTAYSLAFDDMPNLHSEPFLQLDVPEGEYQAHDGIVMDDPLFDPLGAVSCTVKKKPSFTWPRLDPLFLIMTDFQLPRYFDPLIRAKVRPTAEISPIQKVSSVSRICTDSNITITKVSEDKPDMSKSQIRRSSRRKVGRYEMKSLLSDSELLDFRDFIPIAPPPKQTRSTRTNDLAATLSRISGTNITITPIKSDEKKSASSPSSIQNRVVPLDLKDFPWLPKDWKVNGIVSDGGVSHSFISPGGVALSSQAAVVQFLRSADKKKHQSQAGAKKGVPPAVKKARPGPASKVKPAPGKSSGSSKASTVPKSGAAGGSKSSSAKSKQSSNSKSKAGPASAVNKKARNGNKAGSSQQVNHADGGKPEKQEPYKILCKSGSYTCPLCFTHFNLNQAYGRHVVNKKCKVQMKEKTPPKLIPNSATPWILEEEAVEDQEETAKKDEEQELQVLDSKVTRVPLNYVRVNNCTAKDDSYVDISSVPCLKMLARAQHYSGGLLQVPISVKEGLEYYHSIVWKDNNENTFFDELCGMSKLSICSSVSSYEELCREPLKVALFLERKVSISREKFGLRSLRTKNWVQKYEKFLKLPLHDIFLSLQGHRYKVIEYFDGGEVKPMCLNCSTAVCKGCVVIRPPPAKQPEGQVRKIQVPIRVKTSSVQKPAVAPPVSKMARCGSCSGCMLPNCKKCFVCRDMKRYGGEGKLRKACVKRVCMVTGGGASTSDKPASPSLSKSDSQGTSTSASDKIDKRDTAVPDSAASSSQDPKPAFSVTSVRPKSPAQDLVTIDLDSSSSPPTQRLNLGENNVVSHDSYPCTVCKRGFPTRIQMLAHRSVSHNKDNIMASVSRSGPVVLHSGK